MARKIVFGKELRDNCQKTMTLLHRGVASSLGPSGKLSLLARPKQKSLVTKDGVTICKNMLPLQDEVMNLIGGKILEIANHTNAESGDGTTTSIVLANALFEEAVKVINEKKMDPVKVKDEIEALLPYILSELDKKSSKIETVEEMTNVASISANNDREIGALIAKAIDSVGQDGFVTLTEGDDQVATLELTEGMQLNKGPSTERFLKGQNSIDFENPNILIVDGKIDLQETLNDLYVQRAGRPLVVIGELSEVAMEFLLHNSRSGQIDCVHFPPLMFKGLRVKILQDIAAAVGATVIDPINFNFAQAIDAKVMGTAKRLTFNKYYFTIIEGAGKKEEIIKRVAELKEELNATKSEYEKDIVRERIGRLTCGAAVIGVGGRTEDEVYERKDRFQDSLNATRSALLEGIIPGGGYTLFKIAQKLKGKGVGVQIFKNALEAPMRQIIKNTGMDIERIVERVRKSKKGYDARLHKLVDLQKEGIIDPVKSTKSGLKNAVSIVDLLINLECLSVNVIDKDNIKEVSEVLKGINPEDI